MALTQSLARPTASPTTSAGTPPSLTIPTAQERYVFPGRSPWLPKKAVNPKMIQCTQQQQEILSEAWRDVSAFTQAHAQWRPPNAIQKQGIYQAAMNKYLGNHSRADKNRNPFLPGPLKLNILRANGVQVTNALWSPSKIKEIMLYCGDPTVSLPDWQQCSEDPAPVFYTLPDTGFIKYIVLCEPFFRPNYLEQLNTVNQAARANPTNQAHVNYWVNTKPAKLLHETYH